MKQRPKILIIHPEGNIKNNPNLYYFTKELVEHGFDVIVYSLYRPKIYQGELFPGASFVYYYENKKKEVATMFFLLKQKISFIIGVDEGIVKAEKYANILNVDYSLLSYEIFFDNELKRRYHKRIKKKSFSACRNINFAIVQDTTRKELLIKEYGLFQKKIFFMPVAGRGLKKNQKGSYFRTKLNIPNEKKILLYMGEINTNLLKRLVEYSFYLPNDWVFVIHSRYEYLGDVSNVNMKNVYLSFDKPIENIEDINILLNDCDAGLCSYLPDYRTPHTGDNIKYIGFSSGKTSTFLQHGIPIVVENMNMWEEVVSQMQIGIYLKSKHDLSYLDSLLNDEVRENCFRYFEKYLDIKNYIKPIISEIKPRKISQINRINILYYILEALFDRLKYIFKTILSPVKFVVKRYFYKQE